MPGGFQSKVVVPHNPKLVREAEKCEPVSQVGAVLRMEEAPQVSPCLPLPLSGSTVKLDTTSPSLCCHASAGGGCRGAVGDGLCAA